MKIWFRAKRYGYGWFPVTIEGWLVLFVFLVVFVAHTVFFTSQAVHPSSTETFWFLVRTLVMVSILIWICLKKGEKPGWRWGGKLAAARKETIDILSTNGVPTGVTTTEKEAHKKGLWHKTADVFILNSKGELLIQKRSSHMDSHPDMFHLSAGGHLVSGEASTVGVLRELHEELGLSAKPEELIFVGETANDSFSPNRKIHLCHITDVYLLKMDPDSKSIHIDSSEVSKIVWLPWKDFEKKIQDKDPAFVQYPGHEPLFKYLHTTLK